MADGGSGNLTIPHGTWQDWNRLVAYLGMESKQDLTTFIAGPLFAPAFQDLFLAVIGPAQELAQQTNKPRPRGPHLRTVQAAYMAGERHGLRKYSKSRLDQSGWTAVDHYALFLHRVKDDNLLDREGIFYGKGLSATEVETRVWLLYQRVSFDHAPARKQGSISAGLLDMPSKGRKPSSPSKDSTTKPSSANAASSSKPAPETTKPTPDPPLTGTDADDEGIEILDNETRMWMECSHDTMDTSDRAWRKKLMFEAADSQGSLAEFKTAIDSLYADDRLNDKGSVLWARELAQTATRDGLSHAPFTEETAAEFERVQEMFDNRAYQRENIEEAARNLNIQNIDMPRMPGMLRNSVFKQWQPVGINAIRAFRSTRPSRLRGCVLADGVGLGKTWITLGYILSVG